MGGRRTACARVAEDVARSYNGAHEASLPGLAHQVLACPFCLTIASCERRPAALESVAFGDAVAAGRRELVGQVEIVVGVQDSGGGDERDLLRPPGRSEVEGGEGGENVCGFEGRVGE